MEVASKILSDVRKRGDSAVVAAAKRYDGSRMSAQTMRVSKAEINAAKQDVDAAFKTAAKQAHARISLFAEKGLRKDWSISTSHGGVLGERFIPFDRIGAYIPGGAAPLASTALMTLTLAKVAGVRELVACSPADKKGFLNPYIIYALDLAGADEIYKIGGVQAIGAMAYGTETIKRVRKIQVRVDPTSQRRKDRCMEMWPRYGAGPSEIAILCDGSANPAHMAADLLSQAEHGTGSEKSLLVTTSEKQAKAIRAEVVRQAKQLSRQGPIREVMEKGMLLVTVKSLREGIELCNRFAPEHMELVVKDPARWIDKITTAGALFVGPYTPRRSEIL